MTEPLKLSSSELASLKAKAARGEALSPAEVAQFVASTRASYLAAPKPKGKKAKESQPSVSEKEIDFF